MVQTEKSVGNSNMLTLSSSDPFARKQGQSGMCGKSAGPAVSSSSFKMTPQTTSTGATNKGGQSQQQQQQYGSWGPVFKNKDNFASLHFC